MNHVESNQKGCDFKGRGVRECSKIVATGDHLCPHHRLLLNERDNENAARMKRARNGKARKAVLAEALKTSPLRAENPAFAPERTGYES